MKLLASPLPTSPLPPLLHQTISRTLLRVVTNQLPSNRTHGTRYLRFGPDGQLYFGIGSPCPDPCNSRTSPQGLEYSSLYRLNVTSGALIVMARGGRRQTGPDDSVLCNRTLKLMATGGTESSRNGRLCVGFSPSAATSFHQYDKSQQAPTSARNTWQACCMANQL
jgi:hypothetical protein